MSTTLRVRYVNTEELRTLPPLISVGGVCEAKAGSQSQRGKPMMKGDSLPTSR
jgi:hypothetical protein